MTKARDLANIISGGFTADDIPNLDAAKITSGTFADARLSASSVQQFASTFDDNKIVNDISTLGLRVHTQENLNASNTNSASFDVFQDSSAISNLTNCARDSGEYVSSIAFSEAYETGDRESSYTITLGGINSSDYHSSGDPGNWLNGNFANNGTGSWYWSGAGSNMNGNTFTFDLGSGNSKIYVGAKFFQNSITSASSGNWRWQGSNNGSSFTDLTDTFEWNGDSGQTTIDGYNTYFKEVLWSNDTAYRYIRLEGQSGATTTNNPWQQELQWKVKTGSANATGSFEGNAITAASTSSMGAVLTYQDNAGVNTLNTDIILKLSADNGSNYSTATLTALPDFATGIKMAKVNDLSVTAGTQLKYKIEFANQASGSKEARIRGVSLQY